MEAVLRTEMLKQIRPPLTDQQRVALAVEIQAERWTPAELANRARSVALRETYGNLALHHWLEPLTMTAADARKLAERMIEDRRRILVQAGMDEDELERLG